MMNTAPKEKLKIIKKIISKYRCDARVYGEKVEIPATTAIAYKSAQCEKNGTISVVVDDGELFLCKTCSKKYEVRDSQPILWHGFFDDGQIPLTSHILGGPWHLQLKKN